MGFTSLGTSAYRLIGIFVLALGISWFVGTRRIPEWVLIRVVANLLAFWRRILGMGDGLWYVFWLVGFRLGF